MGPGLANPADGDQIMFSAVEIQKSIMWPGKLGQVYQYLLGIVFPSRYDLCSVHSVTEHRPSTQVVRPDLIPHTVWTLANP